MKRILAVALASACLGAFPRAYAQSLTPPSAPYDASTQTAGEPAHTEGPHLRLTFDDAVSRTLEGAPLLRAGDAGIGAAAAAVDQAGVRPNPQVGVEIENFTGSGPYSDFGSTEYTLTYSQQLERGGKRSARVALAQADRDVALLDREKSKLDLIYSVRQAWIGVLQTNSELDNAIERLALAENIGGIVRRRVNAARDPLAAGLRAENQIAEARTEVDQALRAFTSAKIALAALWGGKDGHFTVDAAEFSQLSVSYPSWGQLATKAATPPDLAALDAQVTRAERSYAVEKTRAKQDPVVGVGVRRFENGNDFAGLVSVSIPIALFDTNRGNINRAMAQRQQAEWTLAEAKRRYNGELQVQLAAFNSAKAEATAIRNDLLPRAQEAVESFRDGYNRGAFSYLEVADAEKSLVDLRARETAALSRYHHASAAIDRLTGQIGSLAILEGEGR